MEVNAALLSVLLGSVRRISCTGCPLRALILGVLVFDVVCGVQAWRLRRGSGLNVNLFVWFLQLCPWQVFSSVEIYWANHTATIYFAATGLNTNLMHAFHHQSILSILYIRFIKKPLRWLERWKKRHHAEGRESGLAARVKGHLKLKTKLEIRTYKFEGK